MVKRSRAPPAGESVPRVIREQDLNVYAEVSLMRDQVNSAIHSVEGILGTTIDAMRSLLMRMELQMALLESKEKRVQELDDRMRAMHERASQRIKLSLRGKVFETEKSTLLSIEGTYFYAMLSTDTWLPDDGGVYFADRPHEGFDRILSYLSTGKLSYEGLTGYEIECIESNFDYFQIPFPEENTHYASSKDFVGHQKTVFSIIQLSDGRLCTGSLDKTIKIWNLMTGVVEKTFIGHEDAVTWIVELPDKSICSSSADKTVKIWDLHGEVKESIVMHTATVKCVIVLKNGWLCCATEEIIKLYNLQLHQIEKTLEGHSLDINAVIQLEDGRIVSGSSDKFIRVWSIESGAHEAYKAPTTVLAIVELRNGKLSCCLFNKTIQIWNLATGMPEITLEGIPLAIFAIQCSYDQLGNTGQVMTAKLLHDGKLCTGSSNPESAIKVWNTETGKCERAMLGHSEGVRALCQLKDGRICSSGCDKVIKIWN